MVNPPDLHSNKWSTWQIWLDDELCIFIYNSIRLWTMQMYSYLNIFRWKKLQIYLLLYGEPCTFYILDNKHCRCTQGIGEAGLEPETAACKAVCRSTLVGSHQVSETFRKFALFLLTIILSRPLSISQGYPAAIVRLPRVYWRRKRWYCPLKGVCHESFDLPFFHKSTPFGSLTKRLKYFPIRFQIRR